MKNLFYTLIVIASFVACKGSADTNTLEGKKAKLSELQQQQAKIAAEAATLEKEIVLKDTSMQRKEKLKLVSVIDVTTQNFDHFIEMQGSVVADKEQYITARTAGAVTRVLVNVGDKVAAGQAIAYLDGEVMNKGLAELENRLTFASDVYNKQKGLWDQGIGTEVQYLSAKNNKEALEKSMQTMREQMNWNVVRSPISGVIDELPVKIGSMASPGIPLAKIINFSTMKVRSNVAEAYAGKARKGQAVTIFFPDLKRNVGSTIKYVGNSINPLGRTFAVEAPLKGNEPNVLPNMIAILKISDYHNAKAIVIPINLVQKSPEGDYTMVVDNSTGKAIAKKIVVKTGQFYGDNVEILSGLKAKDRIVTAGFQDLNEGDVVKIN